MNCTVIRLKNGRVENISRDRHFIDLVRECMGDDSAEWFEKRLNDVQSEIDAISEELGYLADPKMHGGNDIKEIRKELTATRKELEKVAIST